MKKYVLIVSTWACSVVRQFGIIAFGLDFNTGSKLHSSSTSLTSFAIHKFRPEHRVVKTHHVILDSFYGLGGMV